MNTGRALERDVRAAAVALYNAQIAYIFKCPEEMQQTPCDFFGFTRAGRAILIECKTVNRPNLPMGSSPGLMPHQIRALKQASQCEAISIVIWRRGSETAVFEWGEVAIASVNRKSIPWPGYSVRCWQDRLRFLCSRD